MPSSNSSHEIDRALSEARRLLDVLLQRLPALTVLEKELGPLAPHLRNARKVLNEAEARSGTPSAWSAQLESMLRALRAEGSRLRPRGSHGHAATVIKALMQIEALLRPLMNSRGRPPPEDAPQARMDTIPPEDAHIPRAGPSTPLRGVRESRATSKLPHGPARVSSSGMHWSVGALALMPMARSVLLSSPPSAPSRESREEEPAQVRLLDELLEAHLERLVDAFDFRLALLNSGKATGNQLASLEGQFLVRTDALRWLGTEAIRSLEARLASAEDAGTSFAAALPLLSLEGSDTLNMVRHVAERAPPEVAVGLVEAFRFTPHPQLPSILHALSGPGMPAFLRAPILELLVQYGQCQPSQLQAALTADEPDLVAAAARSILTSGRVEFLDLLEALLTHELEPPADTAVMIAASVLGTASALERVRARLAGSAAPPPALVRLLAACGTREDFDLLWALARKKGTEAEVAVWALARLGTPTAIPRLEELLNDPSTSKAAADALQWLKGTELQVPAAGRVARGVAWTAESATSVLVNPSVSALEREWAFWELAARTGLHVPFDVHWPWAQQQRSSKEWANVIEKVPRRLAVGHWLSRGKLSAKRTTP